MKTNVFFMQNREKKSTSISRFLLGLSFALAIILASFEWKTNYNVNAPIAGNRMEDVITVEEMPVIIIKKEKQQEQQETVPKKNNGSTLHITNKIEVVDNSVEVKSGPEFPGIVDVKPVVSPEEIYIDERDIFTPVEQMPAFPGGDIELMKFLKNHLTYPKRSKELGITGIVFVEFIIDTDGSMANIKIAKGVSSDIDSEAIRVVGLMPKWIPGSQRNKPVQVGMRMPIRFTLM